MVIPGRVLVLASGRVQVVARGSPLAVRQVAGRWRAAVARHRPLPLSAPRPSWPPRAPAAPSETVRRRCAGPPPAGSASPRHHRIGTDAGDGAVTRGRWAVVYGRAGRARATAGGGDGGAGAVRTPLTLPVPRATESGCTRAGRYRRAVTVLSTAKSSSSTWSRAKRSAPVAMAASPSTDWATNGGRRQ